MTSELTRLSGVTDFLATRSMPVVRVARASGNVANGTGDKPDIAAMKDAAAVIQEHLSGSVQPPTYNVDYLSGLNVMTVRAANTGDVIFQIPGPAALRLAQLIRQGVPLNESSIISETA